MTPKVIFLCTVFGWYCRVWVVERLWGDFCQGNQDRSTAGLGQDLQQQWDNTSKKWKSYCTEIIAARERNENMLEKKPCRQQGQ